MKNRERKIKKNLIVAGCLLFLGVTTPLIVLFFGSYISQNNKEFYFQGSCALAATYSFLAQLYQSNAFQLLCPNSSFEPEGCYELREKYMTLVNLIAFIWKLLALITILLGVLGGYLSKFLIQNGIY